jgi:hypothetical protein
MTAGSEQKAVSGKIWEENRVSKKLLCFALCAKLSALGFVGTLLFALCGKAEAQQSRPLGLFRRGWRSNHVSTSEQI